MSLIKDRGMILEGFCNVNVKYARGRRATMLGNMESYRPITQHEKRMWKIRHEPRKYEYLPLPQAMQRTFRTPLEALDSILVIF